MGPFEVSKELVARLDELQLRAFLERLLVVEANSRRICPRRSRMQIHFAGRLRKKIHGTIVSAKCRRLPRSTNGGR